MPHKEIDTTRSLEKINALLEEQGSLESIISGLLHSKIPLNVLEVGFGHGRVLLELAWEFRDEKVDFFGVDAQQLPPMEKREDLRAIAERFDVIPRPELPGFGLPEIFFYDATKLHFDDESMSFIFSVITIRFIKKKATFLEEVCRVLKPGGVALLHISESNWDYPYSNISNDRILTPYTNRFVLKHESELIPLPAYLKLFEGDGLRFKFTTKGPCLLFVRKSKSCRLDLCLDYNNECSMKGKTLPLRNRKGKPRGGFRSVYNVRPERYQELFQKGLLSQDQLRKNIQIPTDF